jgi:hypothetical protein
MKTKYWYEAHDGDGYVEATSDEEAMDLLRNQFGKELIGLICVSVEESELTHRTVWLE